MAEFEINGPVSADNLYFVHRLNNRIRRIGPPAVAATAAGDGRLGFLSENVPATQPSLNVPKAIAVDRLGNLYKTNGCAESPGKESSQP